MSTDSDLTDESTATIGGRPYPMAQGNRFEHPSGPNPDLRKPESSRSSRALLGTGTGWCWLRLLRISPAPTGNSLPERPFGQITPVGVELVKTPNLLMQDLPDRLSLSKHRHRCLDLRASRPALARWKLAPNQAENLFLEVTWPVRNL